MRLVFSGLEFDAMQQDALRVAIGAALQALDLNLYNRLLSVQFLRGSVIALLTFQQSAAAASSAESLKEGLDVQYAGSTFTAKPSAQTVDDEEGTTTALVAGAVVGSILGVALVVALAVFVFKNRNTKTGVDPFRSSMAPMVANPTYSPVTPPSRGSTC